jgi:hypothetical protein
MLSQANLSGQLALRADGSKSCAHALTVGAAETATEDAGRCRHFI